MEAAARLGCAGAQGVGGRVGGAMGAAGVATVHGGAAETRGPCGLCGPGVEGPSMCHGGAWAGASAAPAGPGGASGVEGSP